MSTTEYELERGLPANADAERSLLGSILMDNSMFTESGIVLQINDFFMDSHRRIYAAMSELTEEGVPLDIVTLSEFLRSRKELEAVGGVAYLSSLTDGTPMRSSIGHYLEMIREKSRLRGIIRAASEAITQAMEESTADECSAALADKLLTIQGETPRADKTIADYTRECLSELEDERVSERNLLGATLAIPDLDSAVMGLRRHELLVLAGQAERGKTAFVFQIIRANLNNGDPAAVFSLEMPFRQLLRRNYATVSGIFPSKLREPRNLNSYEWDAVKNAAAEFANLPIYPCDIPTLTPSQLVARARLLIRRKKVRLVVIDNLKVLSQYAQGRDERMRTNNAMAAVRALARSEDVSVILVHHISRQKDINTIPNMQSLKESGDIEIFADIVLALHRPETEQGVFTNKDLIIMCKMREGSRGPIKVQFMPKTLEYEMRQGE